jgi:arginase family enzyme
MIASALRRHKIISDGKIIAMAAGKTRSVGLAGGTSFARLSADGPSAPAIADEWGLSVFSADALRSTSAPLLDWLGDTGATKVAIHFDVDTIDADEIQLGLGADLGGLTSAQARRVVADIDGAAEVIALTIAEFIPRQVMHMQQILAGFPLLDPRA